MKIGENGLEPTATPPRMRAARLHPSMTRPRDANRAARAAGMARILAGLLGRVDDTTPDPARAAQLALLRNAVAAGRYQPDLHEVARKLLIEFAAERVR